MTKPVSQTGKIENCTAKGGPTKCRFHSKQFTPHPLAGQYKVLEDVFIRVEREMNPNLILPGANTEFHVLEQFEEDSRRIAKQMTKPQKNALLKYTDEYGSNNIRVVLSNPGKTFAFNEESMEQITEQIQHLDSALSDHGEDMQGEDLWRGVKSLQHELSGIGVGKEIHFPSYTSTSMNIEMALSFSKKANPILMKIRAKKGLKMDTYYHGEQEVLLERGKTFRVTNITENVQVNRNDIKHYEEPYTKNVTLIEVEEI
jgi:hypothetical protein